MAFVAGEVKETNEMKEEVKTEEANDVKSDDSKENTGEKTKLDNDIIRQVEYYFSDANLHRDKFLLEQISKNEDGWVPLSVLITFKRLAQLSTDIEVIATAVLKSDEGLLEISEDKQKLRRHPECPVPEYNEERRKDVMGRTVYVKGFQLDCDMSELLDFFGPYEKVVNLNMRKYHDKATKMYKFKGSVFVTFESKQQAQDFLDKDKVVYKERELLRKWQEIYADEKRKERLSKLKNKKSKPEEHKVTLPAGTVLFFEGATETVTREQLREAVEKVEGGKWEIAYIDYNKGEKSGHIRLSEENSAGLLLEKITEKKLKLENDVEIVLRTLTDEEEKSFLANVAEQMKSRRKGHFKNKGGKCGHFHRGRQSRRGHKRHGGRHNNDKDENPESKKKKTDNGDEN